MIGQMVGNYKIVSTLGEGGMGTVFKAVDVMLEREVAIKMLRAEIASQPDIVERFRSEAVTLAKLNHPAIATLYSFFRQGDQFFMVLEYVAGETLDAAIRQSGPMPADRAVSIVSQALEGIAHAHAQGILHRDLKPANIMLPAAGGVKVMDFGIARLRSAARMTRTGGIVGTLDYIAPERVRGQETDLRSDLYSMGVVLYEMLAGRVPFQKTTEYDLMRAHLEEAPPPLATLGCSVPPAVEAALIRALAKNPDDRFSSAAEFRSALPGEARPVQEVIKPTRLAQAVPSVTAPRKAGRKRYAGLAAALLVVAATGGILALRRHAPQPQPAPAAQPAPPPATMTSGVPSGTPPLSPPGMPSSPSAATVVKDLPVIGTTVPEAPPKRETRHTRTASAAVTQPALPPGPPLTLPDVLRLLNDGVPSSQVARIVERRGVTFTMNPSASQALQNAGAGHPLVAAVASRYVGGQAPPAASPAVAQTPVPPAPVTPTPVRSIPTPPPPGVNSLLEVRSLYIEPMADDLHLYIAEQIERRLGGRIQVVATKAQADAVMSGSAAQHGGVASAPGRALGVESDAAAQVVIRDRSGSRILWSDEAKSHSVLMGVVRKGGPRKLAEHLVSDLRKALR